MQRLAPWLFHRLEQLFGVVRVANEGEPAVGRIVTDPVSGKQRWEVESWGETYRVCCPFCADRKFHLWLPHVFGSPDPANPQYRIYNCGVCFRRQCLKVPDNRRQFREWIMSGVGLSDAALPRIVEEGAAVPLRQVEPPGRVLPLDSFPDDHPVIRYLASRRFTRDVLRPFGVGVLCWTHGNRYPSFLNGSIYIPIWFQGVHVGWQCRHPRGYYTMPGLKKGRLFYNWDNSCDLPFIVLMEGVTDVWRFGNGAVALLGKDFSRRRLELLCENPNRLVVICLDADDPDAAEKAMEIERQIVAAGLPTKRVRLPEGKDPASLETGELYQVILSQLGEYKELVCNYL